MKKVLMLAVVAAMFAVVGCSAKYKVTEYTNPQGEVITLNIVHFAFDSSELTPEEKEKIKANAQTIKDEKIAVIIEGHTDDKGTEAYNYELGKKRAEAVKKEYVKNNVPASKVAIVSYGKTKPVDTYASEQADIRNRRAETNVQVKK
jgi:outer membrane protein OmpA-like peptidoglycan-associated protein